MKYLLMISIFVSAFTLVKAQKSGSGTSMPKKTQTLKGTALQQQKGSGQFHGSRDTTPGSPIGTGGAGGDMSGSPAASAIETDDQTSKAQVQKDTIISSQTSATEKRVYKKRKTAARKTRHSL